MPYFRHRSFVFAPASASLSTPMICSSVNRRLFIRLLPDEQTLLHSGTNLEEQTTASRTRLGTPYLSLSVDAESRAVPGFYVSLQEPSYRSCMMVLRDIVRRHGRLPNTIIVDNGPEFHSAAFQRFCELYGITVRYRPAG